jgi:hypothetical protein
VREGEKQVESHLRRKFTSDIWCKLMDDVGIEVARWVNVAEDHGKGFIRRVLLGSNVCRSEFISAGVRSTQIDGVRHLKVIAKSLVDHQLGSLEEDWHDIYEQKREKSRGSVIKLSIIQFRFEVKEIAAKLSVFHEITEDIALD